MVQLLSSNQSEIILNILNVVSGDEEESNDDLEKQWNYMRTNEIEKVCSFLDFVTIHFLNFIIIIKKGFHYFYYIL